MNTGDVWHPFCVKPRLGKGVAHVDWLVSIMEDLTEFDRLVGLIYEIPLAPERLPAVLEHLTRWLDGDTCHLVGWRTASREPLLSVSVGLDDGVGPGYAAYYAGIDPRRQLALDRHTPGQLLVCHQYFDARFVSKSEFYQDYLLPVGVHYLLATTLLADASHLVQIAFQRYVGHGHFSTREMQWSERLIPHLQRAIALLTRGAALQQCADLASAGLEASPLAVIAIDRCGRPVFCNRRAEALLRDGAVLGLCNGVLQAARSDQRTALAAAIRASAGGGKSGNLVLGTRPGSARPMRYSVTTVRVPQPERDALPSAASVLCLIAPLGARRLPTAGQLVQLFGLSPAEARLLRALAQGATLEEYARECDVRTTTVKSQLQSLFSKTGTRRQADLVRLVMDIPAVRS